MAVGDELTYIYDLGDSWQHEIKVLDYTEHYRVEVPQLLEAENRIPPEDVCGGAAGFVAFLEALENPDHPDHDQMVAWYGYSSWDSAYSFHYYLPCFLH